MSDRCKQPAGYFGIGVFNPKTENNVGTLWRSAHNFGAQFIFTIGTRWKYQCSDTTRAWRRIPLFEYQTFDQFANSRPRSCQLVGIEQSEKSVDLVGYWHFPRAIYILGAEDNGLPDYVQEQCNAIIHISTPMCLNVAVAGSIVLYDRTMKFSRLTVGKYQTEGRWGR
jgi:tRNA(Leu) C34 or U34 (ribose-2'-O)-methylase TrmL